LIETTKVHKNLRRHEVACAVGNKAEERPAQPETPKAPRLSAGTANLQPNAAQPTWLYWYIIVDHEA
jgi:hypothetical protein